MIWDGFKHRHQSDYYLYTGIQKCDTFSVDHGVLQYEATVWRWFLLIDIILFIAKEMKNIYSIMVVEVI